MSPIRTASQVLVLSCAFASCTALASNNAPPEFVTSPLAVADVGHQYLYAAVASDPDQDEIVYAIDTGPEGLLLDAGTGELTWAPQSSDVGLHAVVLRATDPSGAFATQAFELRVLEDFCSIYPIALPHSLVGGLEEGVSIEDLALASGAGQFGWLTWTGASSVRVLAQSLVPPGDSYTYVSPTHSEDGLPEVGDWIRGAAGEMNARAVRDAVAALLEKEIILPTWDEHEGQGSSFAYRVGGFARVRMSQVRIEDGVSVSFEFRGLARCYNDPPVALDQTLATSEDQPVDLILEAVDPDGDDVSFTLVSQPTHGTLTGMPPLLSYAPAPNFHGSDSLSFVVSDGEYQSGVATVALDIAPVNDSPTAQALQFTTGQDEAVVIELAGEDVDGDALVFRIDIEPSHGDLSGLPPNVLYTPNRGFAGEDRFTYVASDGLLDSTSAEVLIDVVASEQPDCDPLLPDANGDGLLDDSCITAFLPPDPRDVAPPNDPTSAPVFYDSFGFLIEGPTPIQRGVRAGEVSPQRAALLRGRVLDAAGAPLAGALIRVAGSPALGYTFSREDGWYDLLVNGGAPVTVDVQLDGFLRAQRQVDDVPWQGHAHLPDVALVPLSPIVTRTVLGPQSPGQIAKGVLETDQSGTRQATLVLAPGTSAALRFHDGSTTEVSSLDLRLTEYTVGSLGPQRMPAALPVSSGYTYAVEVGADEAIATGAASVVFDRPAALYVDNFLELPVGMIVPVGYYDFQKSNWQPSENGLVIRVLDIDEQSLAVIDADGDGLEDTDAALADLGIFADERRLLGTSYEPGSELWRSLVTHLTPYDCNFPFSPPDDAVAPEIDDLRAETPEDNPDFECGSIIDCQNSGLGESIPIGGTAMALRYNSARAPGYSAGQSATLVVGSRSEIPASLQSAEVTWSIAGRQFRSQLSTVSPGDEIPFSWDKRDVYGREVFGAEKLSVKLEYVYPGYVLEPAERVRSFAQWSTSGIVPVGSSRSEFRWTRTTSAWVSTRAVPNQFPAGWTIDLLHSYDHRVGRMQRGDGTGSSASAVGTVWIGDIGTPTASRRLEDGDHISQGRFDWVTDVEALPNGDLLIADDNRLWRLGDGGLVTHLAGAASGWCYSRPCVPWPTDAKAVRLEIADIAVDKSGCVFVLTQTPLEIVRICDGLAQSVWGGGYQYSSYGLIALADDGRLFFHDAGHTNAVYQIDAYAEPTNESYLARNRVAGLVDATSGYGVYGYTGNDGPASQAALGWVEAMTVGPDGALYLLEEKVIRVITSDGIIRRFAGRPSPRCDAYSAPECSELDGVGGPALEATFDPDGGFASFLDDGTLVFSSDDRSLLAVDPAGTLIELGPYDDRRNRNNCIDRGGCNPGVSLANFDKRLNWMGTVGPDGVVSIASPSRIHQFGSGLPTLGVGEALVADDRGYVHRFDRAGRHVETRDPVTGTRLLEFEYVDGRLSTIVDREGRRTVVERDPSGQPSAIVAPYGQRTELQVGSEGNLSSAVDAVGNAYQMTYAPGGLLETFARPGAAPSSMTYGSEGRLVADVSPVGGGWTLDRTELEDGWRVALTSAEGRRQTYDTEKLPGGERVRTVVHRDGSATTTVEYPDGVIESFAPDGSTTRLTRHADPRFGMAIPIVDRTMTLPSGLRQEMSSVRTTSLSASEDPFSLISLTQVATPNGRPYMTFYDAAERTVTVTSPEGRSIMATLDVNDRPAAVSVPGIGDTAFSYDAQGRLERITQTADGQTRETRFGFDAHGFLATVVDPAQRTTELDNDPIGRTRSQVLPDQRVIGFDQDARGNTVLIRPPGREDHLFDYDDVDQLGVYAPPALPGTGPTDYAYNRDRQLELVTRPDGVTIDPQYDASTGRLLVLASTEGRYEYGWLPGGRVASITAPGGEGLAYTYDGPLLTAVTWTGSVNGLVSFGFDANFWLRSVTAAGVTTQYDYDADGLLTAATASASSLTLTRDPQNGLLKGSLIDGVGDAWVHNGFGEPTRYTAGVNGAERFDAVYTRDVLGRIEHRSETVLGQRIDEHYVYDVAGRLDTVERNGALVSDYRFDENSNRIEHRIGPASPLRGMALPCLGDLSSTHDVLVTGSYDAHDRMETYGTCAFEYTANGELAKRTDTATGEVTTYGYDVFGNLREATLSDGRHITYTIDGQNRRIGKSIDGQRVQGFLYLNQLEPIAELDGNGDVVATFVYSERGHVPSLMLKGGKLYRIIPDHLGSVRLVIETATGETAQRMAYDEYGYVVEDTNPGFQPFGFAGGVYDTDIRLVRFGARDFDASVGRWTTRDPIGFGGRLTNLYSYSGSDPVNFIDLSGKNAVAAMWQGGTWGAAVGGPVGGVVGAAIGLGAGLWLGDKLADWMLNDVPEIPGEIVGDHEEQSTGKRVNTDKSADAFADLVDDLTGGVLEDIDGHKVCPNGIRIRPPKDGYGPRIDIPANGTKPPETIHFPPETIWPF